MRRQRSWRRPAWDRPRAFAAIGEAAWWVTIVDATLVRHHLEAYDDAMAGQTPAGRQLIERTRAGLRFVRNRIGDEADLAEFIEPGEPGPDAGAGDITGWMWKPVPEPKLASLSPRGRSWEMSRYQAYQVRPTPGHQLRRNLTAVSQTGRTAPDQGGLSGHLADPACSYGFCSTGRTDGIDLRIKRSGVHELVHETARNRARRMRQA